MPPGVPGVSPPPGFAPPAATATPPVHAPPPSFVPASTNAPPASAPAPAPELRLPNPTLAQTNPPFKKATEMKWGDANFSPVRTFFPTSTEKPLLTTEQEEHRAIHARYHFAKDVTNQSQSAKPASLGEEPRGKKRARAEDFL